ncbi:low specificity L-threonine aldolase [Marivibrio halodurans]|uniref:L-threonine aldolase n=1 Tax=Marivibrio halodurans TaxID=2039722 RepID=A0A8J7V1V8_9PROT|nr:low specificity L-threonine aldolase [Marivibrio halodurans]MBP5856511.1 low specificity L-threonine aldolase [Marivibrio halodurans]
MNFCSDNVTGAAPEILAHLSAVNAEPMMPYGEDPVTARVDAALAAVFERAPGTMASFPVATGTAANALCLSAVVPPYGAVLCHRDAHINVDECGAPEHFTGGAKLIPLDGAAAKLTPETVAEALAAGWTGVVHHAQPACLSITQATEAGAVYTPDEVAALVDVAHAHGLMVHMDGARFANALVAVGCAAADMTWRAGVDLMSFGATKNGALAAEAAIFFRPELAESIAFRRKRAGHLFSKMRFLSAQLEAYLAGDLWLRNARHANAMAARLASGLVDVPGVSLADQVAANELFVHLPDGLAAHLRARGFAFYPWTAGGADCYRFVTAWCTAPADVDLLIETARGSAAA